MPIPKPSLQPAVFLLLMLLSPLVLAQIYSWVDENGKKHFGDKIPPEYQDQASEYDVPETNSSEAVEVTRSARPAPPRGGNSQADGGSLPSYSRPEPSTCEEQWAAYERSADCFTQCRMMGNNNIARCGHCKQMDKPDC